MSPRARLFPASRALRLAGLAVAGGAVAAILGRHGDEVVLPAYRLAVFACLAPALGSLIFLLIHELTGGAWGGQLRPFLLAGARLAPWIWLLALPLLCFAPPGAPAWPDYASQGMLALRSAAYTAVLFAVARPFRRTAPAPRAWVGPAGLIVLGFTLHLLCDDWLGALEPGWHSTAFPLVWMVGLAISGLAAAILAALAGRPGLPPPPAAAGIDLGNLLLAATLFWCYVAFAQFLIIWAGNLPREIIWYRHRLAGGWQAVPLLLLLGHFFLPFGLLLSRPGKRSARVLGGAAGLLLGMQLLVLAWTVLPAFPGAGWEAGGLSVALLVVSVPVLIHRYLMEARLSPTP